MDGEFPRRYFSTHLNFKKLSNELVINSTEKGGRIALLKDKSLVELHYEDNTNSFHVGDIYLGTVRKVVPGLNAAFIDIGFEKDAFLHYSDLGANFRSLGKFVKMTQSGNPLDVRFAKFKMEPEIEKLGKVAQVMKGGQKMLVQIVKEPISTKGPRLSCEISIPGRYLVLVPFSNTVNVSRKVSNNSERKRLVKLISSIKPENFGVIVRTVAEGRDLAELKADMDDLLDKWTAGCETLVDAKPKERVLGEINKSSSMLRDMLNDTFDSITVDDADIFNDIKTYIKAIAPDKEHIVKLYSGKAKIFEAFGIEKQVKTLFGQTVNLKSGGYLVIEHTEALHVVDVNSGNKSSSEDDQEATAMNVNSEAAAEVARQLRLRDMGGIIVIDFIDMKNPESKRLLYEQMKQEMKLDRSKFTVLPLSKFGLMQITRQRFRPEINIITQEKCPACNGTGKIGPSINVADEIEQNLEFILSKQNEKGIKLHLHPYLHAYFTKGIYSKRIQWLFKYHKWVKCEKDTSLALSEFYFTNKLEEQIEIG